MGAVVEWAARMRRDEGAPGSWILLSAILCRSVPDTDQLPLVLLCCLARYQLPLQRKSQQQQFGGG